MANGIELGKAYVQIVPSAQGIGGKIASAISPEASSAGKMAGETVASNIGSKIQSAGGKMMKAGAIATAVSVPIIAGLKKAMDAYQVQNAAETKLTEIYKTRMGATKSAAKATMDLASALQKEGVVGDEVTLSGAQQLATFAKYPSTVNSLLPAMQNLLVQQKGLNGTTQDATQIANLMGKVMMGQTGALKRVGVSFTEAQEKVLKFGSESERAAMLSKVITENVGEMNKAMLETPEGKIQQMKNALGDLSEQLGAAVAPAIASIAQFISNNIIPKVEKLMNFAKDNPIVGKIIVGITALLAAGGPLIAMIGLLMKSTSSLGGVITKLMSPFGLVIAGVGLLVAAFASAYSKNESFRNAVNGLVSTLRSSLSPIITLIGNAIKAVLPPIMSLVTTIATALTPIIKALIPVIRSVMQVILNVAKAVIPVLTSAIKTIAPIVQAVVKTVAPIIQLLAQIFSKVFTTIAKKVGPIFKTVFRAITLPIKAVLGVVRTVVNAIKKFLEFTGLGKTVSKLFKGISKFISDPIGTAKEKIKNIVQKIKNIFPFNLGKLFKFELPNIFKRTGKKKGTFAFGVSWDKHAAGGIFTRPTLLGSEAGNLHQVGEAGAEAILPLKSLWNQMDRMSEKMGGNKVVNNYWYITVDGARDPEEFAERAVRKLKIEMRTV